MSQPLGYRIPQLLRPRKRKGPPLPSLPPPAREMPPASGQLTAEIPDEQGTDPPTKQMSQLHIQDIAPPDPLPHKRVSGRLTQATRNASIPTWGQIKTLCHQARGIASLQGSPASPEKLFIAMLALLSCQDTRRWRLYYSGLEQPESRILRQNIQKLATELHLAVLRNKKGGDAGSRHIAY
ncbi:periphilin-1-like isoform X1 [Bubalus kerabau]|uniref:periphilin-1-like isoform X1 n=1 Tax=Bubalus carabanensis TaxID=3119969 RepID=UPI00244E854A|nr:periphilin-1-like isoform X1 [Bubalus carabanensis]